MKKMYQTPRTEDVNLRGEKMMIPATMNGSGGEITPPNPGAGLLPGAPQRATKLYM